MQRPILKIGSAGKDVQDLTHLLVAFGHLDKAFDRTAKFDAIVKAGVLSFQSRHVDPTGQPLVPDGVVGPVTWWALTTSSALFHTTIEVPCDLSNVAIGSNRGLAALKVIINEMELAAREEVTNNSGPWVEKYVDGLASLPANWCAALQSWAFKQSGPMPFQYSLGARDVRNQFKEKGWAFDLKDHPPDAGDLCFWWRGMPEGWQGHIGLVSCRRDGMIYVAEGNKGPFPAPVKIFSYVLSRMQNFLGFGRVPD